jgi:cyclopropane-fatty-acyl-phospholipid synthase
MGTLSLMQNISIGQLRVLTYSHIYTFPDPSLQVENDKPDLQAELRVVHDVFWVRLCAMGDLGFAEAYMYGDVECDDLVSLFQVSSGCSGNYVHSEVISQIFLSNREKLSNLNSMVSYLFTLPQKLTSYRFLNTIGNSRSNISAHYDISNDMFSGMSIYTTCSSIFV